MATRKVVVIGSGPAGYTAAIYAARANLAPMMLTGVQSGGQLMLTTLVENYPGFVDGLMGPELMESFRKQAERFGTEMIPEDATRVDLLNRPFRVWGETAEYEAHTVIIATGASAKLLGLDAEMQLMGRGVSTCATCDGFFFKDQKIMVVGGGDSALEEALYLSRLGSSVDLVHRRDTLRASKIMQDRAFKNPKIQFMWDSAVEEILDPAQGKVTGVKLRNVKTGVLVERPVDGLFVAIGHQPNTQLFRGQVEPTQRVHQGEAGDHPDVNPRRLRRRRRAGPRVSAGRDGGRDGMHGRARGRALPRGHAAALAREVG